MVYTSVAILAQGLRRVFLLFVCFSNVAWLERDARHMDLVSPCRWGRSCPHLRRRCCLFGHMSDRGGCVAGRPAGLSIETNERRVRPTLQHGTPARGSRDVEQGSAGRVRRRRRQCHVQGGARRCTLHELPFHHQQAQDRLSVPAPPGNRGTPGARRRGADRGHCCTSPRGYRGSCAAYSTESCLSHIACSSDRKRCSSTC